MCKKRFIVYLMVLIISAGGIANTFQKTVTLTVFDQSYITNFETLPLAADYEIRTGNHFSLLTGGNIGTSGFLGFDIGGRLYLKPEAMRGLYLELRSTSLVMYFLIGGVIVIGGEASAGYKYVSKGGFTFDIGAGVSTPFFAMAGIIDEVEAETLFAPVSDVHCGIGFSW